jgi:glyoxylase-like metal-dependent hydrolase (beta-lactamase superfamily II)
MKQRRYLFPHVIEMNRQAGHRLGVNVYLIEDAGEFVLIDVGYEDTVEEILELIRRMDFSFSACRLVIATHADVDHSQGLARAQEVLRAPIACHAACVADLETGDVETTFARIKAQEIDLPMPTVKVDRVLNDGDVIEVGKLKIQVWSTPGHAPGQLAFKLNNLLFVGDNIYKDGSVGVIDAHHGSHLPNFISSLKRILADDSEYLLPSHGPVFKRDNVLIQRTIDRLTGYQYMADFGTCAVGWPLMQEWDADIASGTKPGASEPPKKKRLPGPLS